MVALAEIETDYLPLLELEQYPFDANGIPMKDFGGKLGLQYEPIVPVYFAQRYLEHYRQTEDDRYRTNLDRMVTWLRRQIVPIGNSNRSEHTIYTHYDYLPYVTAPWISGMNCGRTAELFLQLYAQESNEDHLSIAKTLVHGLLVPIEEGGIMLETASGGWVFEEFGTLTPALWSLNGHCSVLLSFYRYLKISEDVEIREALNRGIDAVEEVLERFDTNDKSSGSKVKLFGFGMLRLRNLARTVGQAGPLLRSVTLYFPNDPRLRIPIATQDDGEHGGWRLYNENGSPFGPPVTIDGSAGRPFTRGRKTGLRSYFRRSEAQAIFRVGLTDNCAVDDRIVVELDHYARLEMPLAVEIHPGSDKSYLTLGKTVANTNGWRIDRFDVRFGDLKGPFGNIVSPDHGYHAMNTDYIEFLNDVRPSPLLARIGQKWRSTCPRKTNQLDF